MRNIYQVFSIILLLLFAAGNVQAQDISQLVQSQLSQLPPSEVSAQFSSLSAAQKSQLLSAMSSTNDNEASVQDLQNEPVSPSIEQRKKDKDYSETGKPSPIESQFIYAFDPDSEIKLNLKALRQETEKSNFNKQYGYDMFKQRTRIDRNSASIPVNDDYVLGPGDNLMVQLWGKVEERLSFTIDREGKIVIPKVGEVVLAGVKYGEVTEYLRKALSAEFINFDLSVSMGRLRSVRFYVLGDVQSPGAYQLSAMSTVFDGLHMAGGPTKMGSLRRVKLIRNNQIVTKFDIYDYLMLGVKSGDIILENNDTIFVPSIGDTISIGGTVKRPAIYEIKKNSSLLDALKLAGGITSTTFYKRVQLVRIEEGNHREVKNLNTKNFAAFEKEAAALILKDGDYINILPISTSLKGYVSIEGFVERPGDYELIEGMHLGDLIDNALGTTEGALKSKVEIYRYRPESNRQLFSIDLGSEEGKQFQLMQWDRVVVYSKGVLEFDRTYSIEGGVENIGEFPIYEGMRVYDAIFNARPLEYAALEQIELVRRSESGDSDLFVIDARQIKKDPTHSSNLLLHHADKLLVKYPAEIQNVNRVNISGQIKYPGRYIVREGESINDLIDRAGGFTEKAYLKGAVYTRSDIASEGAEVNRNRILLNEEKQLVYDLKFLTKLPETDKLLTQGLLESRQASLELLRQQVSQFGRRVIVDIQFEDSNGRSLVLEDGDSIHIPYKPSTIQIVGGVQNPSYVIYSEKLKASDYLKVVGGLTKFADKKEIRIFRVDGKVDENMSKLDPGDVIYVPEKMKVPFSAWRIVDGFLKGVKTIAEGVASVLLIQAVANDI